MVSFSHLVTLTVTIVLAAVLVSQSLVLEGGEDEVFEDLESSEQVDGVELDSPREGKSMLKVTVKNADCKGSNDNGTCVTSKTCKERNGRRLGTCANGFGVCCRIVANCTVDGICPIRINGTRIIHRASELGNWQYNLIRPRGVCQAIIDFQQTQFGPPNTDNWGSCTNDRFAISGSITANPTVCGDMRNQKMYLDYGNSDRIMLSLRKIQNLINHDVDIKINFVSCQDRKVPENCLQYYTDRDPIIRSFGFPFQLINQRYTICMQSNSLADQMQLTLCKTDAELGVPNRSPYFISGDASDPNIPPNEVLGDLDCPILRDWIQVFGQRRLCGFNFPSPLISDTQPFMMRVNFNDNENIIPGGFTPSPTNPPAEPPTNCPTPPISPIPPPTSCSTYQCLCYRGDTPILNYWQIGPACYYTPVDFIMNPECRTQITRSIDDLQNTGFCFIYTRI